MTRSAHRRSSRTTLRDLFWAKVAKADGDGCWLWTGVVLSEREAVAA